MFCCKEISKKEVFKWGIAGGLAEVLYIILVGWFMTFMDRLAPAEGPAILNIVTVLILFVFSAGLSGLFVFGYPAYLALQKKYKEAVGAIIVTFVTMLICFGAAILTIFFTR